MEKLCNQQKLHILLMVTNNWDLCHVSVKATGSHVFLQSPRLAMASSNTANFASWTHISVISWNNSSHGGKQFQFSAGAWGKVLLWVKSGHHGADGSCPPDTQRMYDCLTRHRLPPRRATALRSPPPKLKTSQSPARNVFLCSHWCFHSDLIDTQKPETTVISAEGGVMVGDVEERAAPSPWNTSRMVHGFICGQQSRMVSVHIVHTFCLFTAFPYFCHNHTLYFLNMKLHYTIF